MTELDDLERKLSEHGPRPGSGVRAAVMAHYDSHRNHRTGLLFLRVPLYAAAAAVLLGMLLSALGTWSYTAQSVQLRATRAWVEYMDSLSARDLRLMQASEHFPAGSY